MCYNAFMELDVKKNRAIKIIVIALAILAVLVILGLNAKKEKPLTQEEIIQKQLEELDRLRAQSGAKELTEAEIKNQLDELAQLRKASQTQPLTEETIQKQLNELENLRSQSH